MVYYTNQEPEVMGNFERKLRRAEEDREQVTEAQQRLPTGKVVSSPVNGEFQALPMLGWISLRKTTEVRLLMLAFLLLREGKVRGMLHIEFPLYPETERNTLGMLQMFGWDGRIWPKDEGWPTGSDDEESHKHFLMDTGLEASLIFPPGSGGNATMPVNVSRAKGPFFMPPLPEAEVDPDPKLMARFKELCQDIRVFYPSRKNGETIH
jgi:hypothetical protein